MRFLLRAGTLGALLVLAVACGRRGGEGAARAAQAADGEPGKSVVRENAAGAPLPHVRLQTDWFPQAEHGGFYQALARGFYREAGLDVELLPGGPGAGIKLRLARGDAEFAMSKSDDVIAAVSGGLPFVLVMATMQHDPQAVMVHAGSPVHSLRDLAGRLVIASPSMTWIPYVKQRYGISFDLKPNTYGLGEFLARPDGIQQCLATNEPYFAQQHGKPVRTLSLAESGWDCYPAVMCRRELVRQTPEIARAFVAASVRGWRDYIEGDPAPADALILQRNPQMTAGLLAFSRAAMRDEHLVRGDATKGEDYGRITPARIAEEIGTLVKLNVIPSALPVESVLTTEFLPAP